MIPHSSARALGPHLRAWSIGAKGFMSELLGLLYGTVELAPYSPEWPRLFEIEARRLRKAFAHLDYEIEHVGSTAVPGLSAKPIIDIAIGVRGLEATEHVIKVLEELGYIYRGDGGAESGGHILVLQSAPLIRTHHVHVVELTDPQ